MCKLLINSINTNDCREVSGINLFRAYQNTKAKKSRIADKVVLRWCLRRRVLHIEAAVQARRFWFILLSVNFHQIGNLITPPTNEMFMALVRLWITCRTRFCLRRKVNNRDLTPPSKWLFNLLPHLLLSAVLSGGVKVCSHKIDSDGCWFNQWWLLWCGN